MAGRRSTLTLEERKANHALWMKTHRANVVTSCSDCNRAKSIMSVEGFAEWATRVASRSDQWKNMAQEAMI